MPLEVECGGGMGGDVKAPGLAHA